MNTFDSRKRYAKTVRGLTTEEALKVIRGEIRLEAEAPRPKLLPKELNPQQRLDMIERVDKFNEPVAKVCRDYNISRPTFYKWLKRYQKAAEEERAEVLVDKKPEVERYYRQTLEKYEEAVLSVVAQYPEFGVARIVQTLPEIAGKPIVGHHGVQNILRRHALNTYEKRLAYAQTQVTPVTRLVSQAVGLGTQFVSLPADMRTRLIKFAGVTLLTAFTTTLLLGTIGYFSTITGAAPAASRIGLMFATVSLGVGMLFFAYSMKYYLTLAIVLSFSRQPLEEGGGYALGLNGRMNGNHRNGNGNGGWLQRIFGLSANGGNGNGPTSPANGRDTRGMRNGALPAGGLQPSLDHIKLKRLPFVSIHLPFYNEKKVAERILSACTSMDYFESGKAQYEVIVCDDSSDETKDIVQRYAKKHNRTHPNGPQIKVLHRPTREGFKGGALKFAVEHMNPKTEFCVVFDADFIPYPDTLELFVKYHKATGSWEENRNYQAGKVKTMSYDTFKKVDVSSQERELIEQQEEKLRNKSDIACVAGYQWHVLNKSENWVTRGVRTEYAGSYVVERPGQEILGAFKIIHGSVYMIRADVLKHFGWGTSITEDFELTLRIYEKGFRVVYTPYVQAPSECVSTIKRLIRQRMRWSEGHSFNIKKMFRKLMFNPRLSLMEKLELLYVSPYYLQAFFFIVGTFCWLLAETVFGARLPFWTSLWGWSLVLTNFFSLPLVNAVGLFLEESEEKDYLGILSFVALSYIMVPFQAYASVKGFIEKEEGPWFRTPKTGRITDIFTRGKFYRWISGILPGRRPASQPAYSVQSTVYSNSYLALATANNQFNGFSIKPKRMRWISKAALVVLLIVSITILNLSQGVVFASDPPDPAATQYLSNDSSGVITAVIAWQLIETENDPQGSVTIDIDRNEPVDTNLQIQPGLDSSVAGDKCGVSPDGRGWILDTPFGTGGSITEGAWTFYISETDNGLVREGHFDICVYRTTISSGGIGTASLLFQSEGDTAWSTTDVMDGAAGTYTLTTDSKCAGGCDIGPDEYLYVEYWYHNTTKYNGPEVDLTIYTGDCGTTDPYITAPGFKIPEKVVFFIAAAPFIPMMVLWMKKRKALLMNDEV